MTDRQEKGLILSISDILDAVNCLRINDPDGSKEKLNRAADRLEKLYEELLLILGSQKPHHNNGRAS